LLKEVKLGLLSKEEYREKVKVLEDSMISPPSKKPQSSPDEEEFE
jgi:hypothetical protein